MTKEKARAKFKKQNAQIENLLLQWVDLGEKIGYLMDRRKRFAKKYVEFLNKKKVASIQRPN